MRFIDNLARWWLRRRQKSRRHAPALDLREFVYLDEVSVYSLISSQIGSVAEQYTTKQMDTMSSEITSSAGMSIPSVADAKTGSKVSASNSSERQVLRKSTIQGTYRELRDDILESRLLLPLRTAGSAGGETKSDSLLLAGLVAAGAALDDISLTRGSAVELSVILEPDESFSAMTLIDTLQLFTKFADTQDPSVREGFEMATSLGEILRSMLTGLVPLRGRSIDYSVVIEGGHRWIVHNETIAAHSNLIALASPLIITAVADQSLFWKDVRRVLFGGASYTVMGRVSSAGLVTSWSPVKLANVLRRYSPELAEQLDSLGPLISSLNFDSQKPALGPQDQLVGALTQFAATLGEASGVAPPGDLIDRIRDAAGLGMYDATTPDHWRPAFAHLLKRLPAEWREVFDPNSLAVLRQQCIDDAAAVTAVATVPTVTPKQPTLLLDMELIAVHW